MHPDIIAALRLALAHHGALARRRRRYAFGGGAYEAQQSPANLYTPQANRGPSAPPQQGQMSNRYSGGPENSGSGGAQPYKWSPLYPASGSGTNIPYPAPPPGPSGLLGSGNSTSMPGTAAPSYGWPFPYSAMGDVNSNAGGSGFGTGPAAYSDQMMDVPPEDPTGDWM